MGEVYDAEDLNLKRRVAIKIMLHSDPAGAERFRREAMAAGQLAHPHIAQVTDYFPAAEGEPEVIVMERLEGVTLEAALEDMPRLAVERAIEIAVQVASALAAAHAANITHRDIKPANLFLVNTATSGDFVKVLDFGVAKLLDARGLTASDQIVGTVAYMSPEQAMGDRDVGPASDVFSLGVVLYRMLSGELPHPGDTVRAILSALHAPALPSIRERCPDLPLELVALVDRALAFDRAERFADGAQLLAAIAAVRPAGLLAPPRPPPRSTNAKAHGEAETVVAIPKRDKGAPRRSRHLAVAAVTAGATATAVLAIALAAGDAPQRGAPVTSASVHRDATEEPHDAPSATGDASEVVDAVGEHDAGSGAPASAPRDRAAGPTPAVVKDVVVTGAGLTIDGGLTTPEFAAVTALSKRVPALARPLVRPCYAGSVIGRSRLFDQALVTFGDDGQVRTTTVNRMQTATAREPLVAESRACVERALASLVLERWSATSNTLRIELLIEPRARP